MPTPNDQRPLADRVEYHRPPGVNTASSGPAGDGTGEGVLPAIRLARHGEGRVPFLVVSHSSIACSNRPILPRHDRSG